jgi:quercetin dioxygenase-like cupin family protein
MIALNNFIEELQALLQVPAELGAEALDVAQVLRQRLAAAHSLPKNTNTAEPCSIANTLDLFANGIESMPSNLRLISRNLVALRDHLIWYRRQEPDYPAFMQAHANAQIIGPQGLLLSDDLMVGVSLINAHTTYPDHWHPPAEIYLVLSQGLWRQNEDDWHEPGIGGYVYNMPNVVHAMQSQQTPLLAIWCLPL